MRAKLATQGVTHPVSLAATLCLANMSTWPQYSHGKWWQLWWRAGNKANHGYVCVSGFVSSVVCMYTQCLLQLGTRLKLCKMWSNGLTISWHTLSPAVCCWWGHCAFRYLSMLLFGFFWYWLTIGLAVDCVLTNKCSTSRCACAEFLWCPQSLWIWFHSTRYIATEPMTSTCYFLCHQTVS